MTIREPRKGLFLSRAKRRMRRIDRLRPAPCALELSCLSDKRSAHWDDLVAIGAVGHFGKSRVERRNSGEDADIAAELLHVRDAEIARREQEEGDPQQKEHRPDGFGGLECGDPHSQSEEPPK